MPTLRRKHPCAECPWLRKSAPGYLGADNPEHFYRTSVTHERVPESAMPCHMDIDYNDPDWKDTQYPDAEMCAGTLIYFRNHLKSPRDPGMRDAVRAVEPSPHVFSSPQEFFAHHDPDADEDTIRRALWGYSPGDDLDED